MQCCGIVKKDWGIPVAIAFSVLVILKSLDFCLCHVLSAWAKCFLQMALSLAKPWGACTAFELLSAFAKVHTAYLPFRSIRP